MLDLDGYKQNKWIINQPNFNSVSLVKSNQYAYLSHNKYNKS